MESASYRITVLKHGTEIYFQVNRYGLFMHNRKAAAEDQRPTAGFITSGGIINSRVSVGNELYCFGVRTSPGIEPKRRYRDHLMNQHITTIRSQINLLTGGYPVFENDLHQINSPPEVFPVPQRNNLPH